MTISIDSFCQAEAKSYVRNNWYQSSDSVRANSDQSSSGVLRTLKLRAKNLHSNQNELLSGLQQLEIDLRVHDCPKRRRKIRILVDSRKATRARIGLVLLKLRNGEKDLKIVESEFQQLIEVIQEEEMVAELLEKEPNSEMDESDSTLSDIYKLFAERADCKSSSGNESENTDLVLCDIYYLFDKMPENNPCILLACEFEESILTGVDNLFDEIHKGGVRRVVENLIVGDLSDAVQGVPHWNFMNASVLLSNKNGEWIFVYDRGKLLHALRMEKPRCLRRLGCVFDRGKYQLKLFLSYWIEFGCQFDQRKCSEHLTYIAFIGVNHRNILSAQSRKNFENWAAGDIKDGEYVDLFLGSRSNGLDLKNYSCKIYDRGKWVDVVSMAEYLSQPSCLVIILEKHLIYSYFVTEVKSPEFKWKVCVSICVFGPVKDQRSNISDCVTFNYLVLGRSSREKLVVDELLHKNLATPEVEWRNLCRHNTMDEMNVISFLVVMIDREDNFEGLFETFRRTGFEGLSQTRYMSLTTLNRMYEHVMKLPDLLMTLFQLKVSFEAINLCLLENEFHEDELLSHVEYLDHIVKRYGGCVSWEANFINMALKEIILEAKLEPKIVICGPVDYGKSLILYAILGGITILSGTISILGSVAYVSQTSWIQSGIICDNILFGNAMDMNRYEEDVEVDGDLTEIGQRGLNMNVGQYIQLARTVSRDSDIYLLDDVFSAVDAHASTTHFNECVRTALENKTYILVTRQVEFLKDVDEILAIKNGRVMQLENYRKLMMVAIVFFLIAHEVERWILEQKIHLRLLISNMYGGHIKKCWKWLLDIRLASCCWLHLNRDLHFFCVIQTILIESTNDDFEKRRSKGSKYQYMDSIVW